MESTAPPSLPPPAVTAGKGTFRQRLRLANVVVGMGAHFLLTALVAVLFLVFWWRSFNGPAASESGARREALALLRGLGTNLRDHGAAERMQMFFPEGSCFTWTLYGLGWCNVLESAPGEEELRAEGRKEIRRALDGQESPASLDPFRDTEVRRGVFWLGQRNMLLGRFLQLLSESERPQKDVAEFHRNSAELTTAFLASPTRHLNSYEGMCWPADNVTALCSLGLHDTLFGTDYRQAYTAWKEWTTSHPCERTSLPAGHLHSDTGQHIEPARGCATSLMIPFLSRMDPDWSTSLYDAYRRHFEIRRLGFRMFREWPAGHPGRAGDVDSGPIIWGAGVTATGVGLAAARSQGDILMERDVRDLARMFGLRSSSGTGAHEAGWHFAGLLPVGDAFLAWGWSIPRIENTSGPAEREDSRLVFHLAVGTTLLLLGGQYVLLSRRSLRRLRSLREAV